MKLLKYIAVVFLAINTIACKPSTNKKAEDIKTNLPEKLMTANLNIEGMTCEIGCARTIESKISKLTGVSESKVSFQDKKGTFTYDSNQTSEDKIITTINSLIDGKTYVASHIEASSNIKKECSKECAEKCDHKENEACKTGDHAKPCCAAKK